LEIIKNQLTCSSNKVWRGGNPPNQSTQIGISRLRQQITQPAFV